jgi:hypothetical protein
MDAIAFLAAAIVLVTISARGADHPSRPHEPGIMPMLRLQFEKLSLLTVGIAAGATMLGVLAGKPIGPLTTMMLVGTAVWMLTHPNGWLKYVASLADGCDDRRTDP